MAPPVIIGAGLAGLVCALAMAPRPVVVLGRKIGANQTSSALAQGGIAAAVGEDDSVDVHISDTIAAGAGLCDEDRVQKIIGDAPRAIDQLLAWGVPFDRSENGALALGLEGAHSHRRVVHALGDSTGAVIMKALVKKVRAVPSIMLIEDAQVVEIKTNEEKVSGVVFHRAEKAYEISTDQVVLATGSACALWKQMTVPPLSWGHGLALAARAGASLRDLEFVQFHPTALDVGLDPMPLLSEALRGEGARLVTEEGQSFVDELAARDIVARAIWREKKKGHKVFLDARALHNFKRRFPTIWKTCMDAGIDPTAQPLPVSPVAHYHMGGVATDDDGRTDVVGLWACGEGACTGLHGANRLASNSLLEAVVMGRRVAQDLKPTQGDATLLEVERKTVSLCADKNMHVRQIIGTYVGLERDKEGLAKALHKLSSLADLSELAFVGMMIVQAALTRQESRGGHYRKDYAEADLAQAKPLFVTYNNQINVGERDAFNTLARYDDRNVSARCVA